MTDPIDKVAERLTQLEVTVARVLHDTNARFHDIEKRDLALSSKIDVQVEAIRGDLQAAATALNGFAEESRRTAESIRKEHAADRAILTITLQQHAKRIYHLERRRR
jgi:hypothetical protein